MVGTSADLWRQLADEEVAAAIAVTDHIRGFMLPYQYAALYRLARDYNGERILEIGCLGGCSALVMSLAAPTAHIVTMSPDPNHVAATRRNTEGRSVKVLVTRSEDYLKEDETIWDMIFVDGDHKRAVYDLPWFNHLRIGGLMLFHDYTPGDAVRSACQPVYDAVNGMGERLGRAPDVLVVDTDRIGMAGFYRRESEAW